MGRLNKAREIIAQLRTITPVVIPEFRFVRNPAHRELILSGLRIAMGETIEAQDLVEVYKRRQQQTRRTFENGLK